MGQFKKGDTVRVKNGGPLMTVQSVDRYSNIENGVLCIWFERNQPQEKVFDEAVLKISDNDVRVRTIERG